MYLKVSTRTEDGSDHSTTPEEVSDFLEGENVKVDTDLNHPCVQFPEEASYDEYQRIQQRLLDAGFTAH